MAEYKDFHFPFFDTRIYRELRLEQTGEDGDVQTMSQLYYPHYTYVKKDSDETYTNSYSYVSDFYETEQSIIQQMEELGDAADSSIKAGLQSKLKFVREQKKKYANQYIGHRSLVHPYAIVKLAGASGNMDTASRNLTYDNAINRRFYEIDGDARGGYAKSPTTTTLIKWGTESYRGTQPYAFTDFVFCKWWNRIENNRLITLRRYAEPVTDHIEFPDYVVEESGDNKDGSFTDSNNKVWYGKNSKSAWVPMATAVTYFGEETGNKLSDLLSFSAKYNWRQLGEDNKNPIELSAQQSDAGADFISDSGGSLISSGLSGGLQFMSKMLGFLGDVNGKGGTNLAGTAGSSIPDPYKSGQYENRILGPVNVIMDTYKRERGLKFTQDGLKIKFEYVSRPIAGINNKAVMLDLLANMLLLTYSSGTWFGGLWRYRCDRPVMYPFKFADSMNEVYRGNLFGKNGAINKLVSSAFNESGEGLAIALPDIAGAIGELFSSAVKSITNLFKKDDGGEESADTGRSFKDILGDFASTKTGAALQKQISARVMKGATVPYIGNQRALLTGEPIGNWHLTIGNPLNPIATIGNLIVEDTEIKFSDELGPDDFPIGFEATVTLKHGLGRDRDAIESMFNRGYGRIYSLSSKFRSTADGETKVDEFTGNNTEQGRTKDESMSGVHTMFTNAVAFVAKIQQSDLKNRGAIYEGTTANIEFLSPKINTEERSDMIVPRYFVNPWQMANIM